MRVAYTIEQCWHLVPGGTAVAAIEVARELRDRSEVELVGITAFHCHPPPEAMQPPMPIARQLLPPKVMYDAWTRLHRPRVGRGFDVVHSTSPIVAPTRRPMVATVHDVAFLHDASMFTRRGAAMFRRSLALVREEARVVLCSSRATIDDCVTYGIEESRLRHVPLGVRTTAVTAADVATARARFGLDRPYLLAVGTLEPRKNLARLITACAQIETHTLAVVGPTGWGAVVVADNDRVRALGYVDESTKAALYSGADVFCYPSLREGFGLPVLEAMAQGAAVVTSRGTSTEEVAGNGAVLVDPTDIDDIARGIREGLARREELAVLGLLRAKEMSWARTADLTVAAYRDAMA